MDDILWWGAPATLLVMTLVQLAKGLGFPTRWAGVLSTVIGVAGGVLWHLWADSELVQAIVTGLLVGLSAAGLWSTQKNVREEK